MSGTAIKRLHLSSESADVTIALSCNNSKKYNQLIEKTIHCWRIEETSILEMFSVVYPPPPPLIIGWILFATHAPTCAKFYILIYSVIALAESGGDALRGRGDVYWARGEGGGGWMDDTNGKHLNFPVPESPFKSTQILGLCHDSPPPPEIIAPIMVYLPRLGGGAIGYLTTFNFHEQFFVCTSLHEQTNMLLCTEWFVYSHKRWKALTSTINKTPRVLKFSKLGWLFYRGAGNSSLTYFPLINDTPSFKKIDAISIRNQLIRIQLGDKAKIINSNNGRAKR